MRKLLTICAFCVLLVGCTGDENAEVTEDIEETEVTEHTESNEEDQNHTEGIVLTLDNLDIDGNEITSDIFEGKTTIVNLWATFCSPCIVEMPDLEKIHQGSEDVQVLGIIMDTYEGEDTNIEAGKEIISSTGVTYTNILANEKLSEDLLNDIQAVPTSFIVDENGNIISDFVQGTRDFDFFQRWINSVK